MVKVSVCMECKQWKRGYQDRWNPPFNKHYCVQCWTRFLARASPAEANLVQKPGTKAARYGRTYGCESCGRHKPGWMDEHGNLFYCQPCWQSYETGKPYRPAQRATTQVQKDQRKGDGKGTTKKRQQKKQSLTCKGPGGIGGGTEEWGDEEDEEEDDEDEDEVEGNGQNSTSDFAEGNADTGGDGDAERPVSVPSGVEVLQGRSHTNAPSSLTGHPRGLAENTVRRQIPRQQQRLQSEETRRVDAIATHATNLPGMKNVGADYVALAVAVLVGRRGAMSYDEFSKLLTMDSPGIRKKNVLSHPDFGMVGKNRIVFHIAEHRASNPALGWPWVEAFVERLRRMRSFGMKWQAFIQQAGGGIAYEKIQKRPEFYFPFEGRKTIALVANFQGEFK